MVACIGPVTAEQHSKPDSQVEIVAKRAHRRRTCRGALGAKWARAGPRPGSSSLEVDGVSRREECGGCANFPLFAALSPSLLSQIDDLVAPLVRPASRSSTGADRLDAGSRAEHPHLLGLEAKRLSSLGIGAIVLFGVPARKDSVGSGASDPDGIVQVALKELRGALGDEMVLIADLCLDEYTDHGHCGLLDARGGVDNDATLERYGEVAVAQAEAGAHLVAPSGMMDGQVAAIRAALDGSGHEDVGILAYAAKYASALYGPFREAVDVTIAGGGDRRGYQQDPRQQARGARGSAPRHRGRGRHRDGQAALAYLDVIAAVRAAVEVPVAAYHVSGEYAMVAAAAERGWIDREAVGAGAPRGDQASRAPT